jgi:hypothetical protein
MANLKSDNGPRARFDTANTSPDSMKLPIAPDENHFIVPRKPLSSADNKPGLLLGPS